MNVDRRKFLVGGAALAATALAPRSLLAALEKNAMPDPSRLDLSQWSAVRAQFPLARDVRHFAGFFLVSHPRPVREAIEGFRKTIDANPLLTVEHALFAPGGENPHLAVCADVARYVGGTPEEIAVVGNTTQGLALVYQGLPLQAGDDVLTTTHDHFVHHESIRLATARAGAGMRRIPLHDASSSITTAEVVRRIHAALRPSTRAVGITWVHSSTGVRLPIRQIAEAIRETNRKRAERDRVLLIVDGVHGLGAVDENVADLGCDFFCAGTHKWLFAPRGTGMVWARAASWARLRQTIPSFSDLGAFTAWMEGKVPSAPNNALRMTPGGFAAFEHQWAMGAAVRFHEAIGRDRIGYRIRQLNDQLKDGLAALPRVRLHTPRDPQLSAGITCFEIDGIAPDDVVKRLLERGIVASTSPYKVTYARLAPSLVTDEDDVEAALAAVKAIAAA
jgi:selenocysteine lyase/cysteine desulfurase